MKKVVIVAPTYNEEENIKSFLDAVFREKKNLPGCDLWVLVSDSHSKDKTPQIVRDYTKRNAHVRYLDVEKRGLGLGLTRGLDYATNTMKADILVTMEADLSNNPNQLPQFLQRVGAADVVLGSRYTEGGKIVNWSWWRKAASSGANHILRFLVWTNKTREFTNLYRAFTRKVWQKIRPKVEKHQDWIFVPAFAFSVIDSPFKVMEQPIIYYDRFGGRSKMRTFSYTKNLLRYALRYRVKKSASFFKFLVVGTIGFIINTIVLVLGVRVGMLPSIAGPLGAELAILSNFFWNNIWTFSDRKLTSWSEIPAKFIQFNILSFGSVVIQFIFLKAGELAFGLAKYKSPIIDLPFLRIISWYIIFYVAGVGVGLIWNFIMYSRVIWKKKNEATEK